MTTICLTNPNLDDDVKFDNVSQSKRRCYDTDPTLELLKSENDVTMDAYVLREIQWPMDMMSATTDVPKTSKAKLVPLLVARVHTSLELPKPTDCTVLMDSGASASLVSKKITKKLGILKESKCIWNTADGPIETNQKWILQFMFPELSETKLIEWKMHIVESKSMNYDIIIDWDILEELEIIIDSKYKQITWNEISVPMWNLEEVEHKDTSLMTANW